MSGPPPKPAHLRQRTNKKTTARTLQTGAEPADAPEIPNPDGREWHPLTVRSWTRAWASPMASEWMETDVDALGRLAIVWDQFYKQPDTKALAEIRLQEQRFGITPLDRSRLQWEVKRGEDAERQRTPAQPAVKPGVDLRKVLKMVTNG